MNVKKIKLFCLVLFSGMMYGQTNKVDTILTLKEVVIKSNRLQDYAIGSVIQKIDSLDKQIFNSYSMADLLSVNSLGMVLSTGLGGVSNSSIRGGGSAHTAVIWNGVNIQSPMNGGVDLALIPSGFVDNVHIQYGGSSTLYGSGAASGVIHLQNDDLFDTRNHIKVQGSLGSFNTKGANISFKIGNQLIANSFKYYFNQADNNFKYRLPDGSEVEQTNAGLIQRSFINDVQIKTGRKSILTAAVWYQNYDKEVQTLISDIEASEAKQEDENIKLALNWQYTGSEYNLTFKSVYLKDNNYYIDPNPFWGFESTNRSKYWINEATIEYAFDRNHIVIFGINLNYEEAESENYIALATRRRISAFASHKIKNIFSAITLVNSVRREMIDGKYNPPVFSSGLRADLTPSVIFNGNISRIYSNPNLNSLYWSDSWMKGNPNLKPEYGWSMDVGFEESIKCSVSKIIFKQNFFINHINDWIVWLPDDSFIWNAENKNKGKTIGIDFITESVFSFGRTKLRFSFANTWTESKFIDIVDDVEVEYPMIYVPKHRIVMNMGIQQDKWSATYTHNYFDKRYTGSWMGFLGAYYTGNLSFHYNIPINQHKISTVFQVHNIWNANYQIIGNYAMPGRNFKFSLIYDIDFKK